MMEIMLMIRKMAMECLHGSLGISIKAIMLKMKERVMGKCHGLMVPFIKVNGKKVSNMDMVR